MEIMANGPVALLTLARRSAVLKWWLKWAHELLKLVCYGNGHRPLKTCLQPRTHMAATVMLVGLGVKANNKPPLLPFPRASTEAAASGECPATRQVMVLSPVRHPGA